MMKHIVIIVIFLIVLGWLCLKHYIKIEGNTNSGDDSTDTNSGVSTTTNTTNGDDSTDTNSGVSTTANTTANTTTGDDSTVTNMPSFGGWVLYLKQTYKKDTNSGFTKNTPLNKGDITQPNFYNNGLTLTQYNGELNFKLVTVINNVTETITWSQGLIQKDSVSLISNLTFEGLQYGVSGLFETPGPNTKTILGSFKKTQPILNDQPISSFKLYVWEPRPNSLINSENIDFTSWNIPKVSMKGVSYFNKTDTTIVTPDDTAGDTYSYCFGKLKCSDGTDPTEPGAGKAYAPYCDDNEKNPVYCSGSVLYSVNDTTNSVDITDTNNKNVKFDLMGQYVNTTDPNSDAFSPDYYNKFRGLTIPSTDKVEIDGDFINYTRGDTVHKIYKCDVFDNIHDGYDMKTSIKQACENVFPKDSADVGGSGGGSGGGTLGKKCIANKGDPLHDTSYIGYVCGAGETCNGYKCGVNYGVCEARAECGGTNGNLTY